MSGLGDLPQDLRRREWGPSPGRRGPAGRVASPTRREVEELGVPLEPGGDCLELARCIAEALGRTIVPSEPSPLIACPIRGRFFDSIGRGIIIASAAGANPGTSATRISDATGISILSESAVDGWLDQVLLSIKIDPPNVGILKKYGFEAEGGPRQLADLQFSISIGGSNRSMRFPNNENQPMGAVDEAGLAETFAVIPPGETVRVLVSNTSTLVPHVVAARLKGWYFPVDRWDESLRGLFFRSRS